MADLSVRPARVEDVAAVARVQVETWRAAYAQLLPPAVLAAATVERSRAEWSAAVAYPPTPRHRVLVALEQQVLVGFVAFGPAGADADAPDAGEIATLLVEPRWGRRGHGSRLLAATVERLRDDGLTRALVWVVEGDRATAGFYESAGWERNGYVRILEADSGSMREARYHVSLAESGVDGEGAGR